MTIEVLDPADLPPDWPDAPWLVPSPTLAPRRVAAGVRDPRWLVRFVTDVAGGTVRALTPIARPRTAAMADQAYDVARLSDHPGVPVDARRWLLVGGCRDLRSGILVRRDLAADEADALRAAVARAAFDVARREDQFGVAAYVSEVDARACLDALDGHGRAIDLGATATIPVVSGSMDDFVASLPSERRRKVRRDWRLFDEAGLRAVTVPAADAIESGAPLVSLVKQRYGVPDDARLAAWRLRSWLAAGAGEYIAFEVRDRDDRVVTVSFAMRYGDALEVHEIGMAESEVRLLGYLESGYYSPIRYAQRHGCRTIEQGMGCLDTKRFRGAKLTPLLLVHPDR